MTPLETGKPASVVVVEDDDHTRTHLCAAVEAQEGYVLAASFDSAPPAIAWLKRNSADILLTDLGLREGSGIDVIRACARCRPACDIMVITMFGDEKNVLSSIEAGATGYILKDDDRLDIARAMYDLRAGGSPMSPLIARKVLARVRRQEEPHPASTGSGQADPGVVLTKREAETLDLIARGYTYEEVARLHSVSLSTVQTHIRGIYGKLSVNSRSEAVYEAHKLGLLQDGLLKR